MIKIKKVRENEIEIVREAFFIDHYPILKKDLKSSIIYIYIYFFAAYS